MNKQILESREIEFNGEQRRYDIVSENIGCPAPKYFISYGNGTPFISKEVPEDYRNPMVLHELTEFELYQDKKDRCLKSLEVELETLPKSKIKKYMSFRAEVFSNLINFLEKHESNSPLISEAKKKFSILKQTSKPTITFKNPKSYHILLNNI